MGLPGEDGRLTVGEIRFHEGGDGGNYGNGDAVSKLLVCLHIGDGDLPRIGVAHEPGGLLAQSEDLARYVL